MSIQYAFLIPIVFIASWTDLTKQKIHNSLLFPSFLLALIIHFLLSGFEGIEFSIIGSLTGFLLLIVPYILGGLGAGDVKLLIVIGAFGGLHYVLMSFIIGALLGGLFSLILIYSKKTKSKTFPYGIFLGVGALLSIFLQAGGLNNVF